MRNNCASEENVMCEMGVVSCCSVLHAVGFAGIEWAEDEEEEVATSHSLRSYIDTIPLWLPIASHLSLPRPFSLLMLPPRQTTVGETRS